MRPMDRNSDYPPWFQKVGHAYLNGLRWLLVIPGAFAVGGLVAFVGVLLLMFFHDIFISYHPNWIEHPLFLIISRSIILVLSFIVGFSATVYGKRIAPSENKKIPGLIITASLALLFLTDFPMKGLIKILGPTLGFACCVITVLTSLVTALRLKPVKRAALLRVLGSPEHIDPDRVPTDSQPQAEVKKNYTYSTPHLIFLLVAGGVASFLPKPYPLFVLLGAMLISSGIKYWPKIARFFGKS